MKKAIAVVLLVLLVDQILKIYVKTHFVLGEAHPIIGNWSYLLFIENEGMAFGWKFFGTHGKLALSLFRIIAATGIGYYLYTIIRKGAKTGMIIAFSFILAGAVGNIIDCALYGLLFTESTVVAPGVFDPTNGYAGFLYGKVVDMLYFPVIDGYYPQWGIIPESMRGQHFVFFRPVFNMADTSITIGVLILLLFQRRFFHKAEVKVCRNHDDTATTIEEEFTSEE